MIQTEKPTTNIKNNINTSEIATLSISKTKRVADFITEDIIITVKAWDVEECIKGFEYLKKQRIGENNETTRE